MIDVNSIFRQRIEAIQSRVPINMGIQLSSTTSTSTDTDFQSLLKEKVSAETDSPITAAYTASLQNTVSSTDRSYIESVINDACREYNVDPDLIRSIIQTESGFNPNVVSSAGAMGLMQLMPSTAQGMGVTNALDVTQNIYAGVQIIKNHLEAYNGDVSLALAAYNAGSGSVQKYGGIPPYTETQNYIKTVLAYFEEYSSY